ncbi:hypothetical protein [Streptomyces sp.]|uniref:hypothetical protein n=1 Tax=Streptomyces sp. TaxID=1931 RepID=UPI002F421695
MPKDIEAILKQAKPRETTVPVYMAGDLVAEIERLERQLAEAGAGAWKADSLADTNPTRAIAEKIEAVREKLKKSEVEFRFRALPDDQWSDLLAAHPPKDSEQHLFNPDTFPRALIAACAVDPIMEVEQVDRLFGVLNQAQRNALFDGAYGVNTEGTSVPFSVSASAILGALGDGK